MGKLLHLPVVKRDERYDSERLTKADLVEALIMVEAILNDYERGLLHAKP